MIYNLIFLANSKPLENLLFEIIKLILIFEFLFFEYLIKESILLPLPEIKIETFKFLPVNFST